MGHKVRTFNSMSIDFVSREEGKLDLALAEKEVEGPYAQMLKKYIRL